MKCKQRIVKLINKEEGDFFIKYLENIGLKNVNNLSYDKLQVNDKLQVKVVVVDSNKFFATNVTCLAAAASCGIRPISVEEFKNNKDHKETSDKTFCII